MRKISKKDDKSGQNLVLKRINILLIFYSQLADWRTYTSTRLNTKQGVTPMAKDKKTQQKPKTKSKAKGKKSD